MADPHVPVGPHLEASVQKHDLKLFQVFVNLFVPMIQRLRNHNQWLLRRLRLLHGVDFQRVSFKEMSLQGLAQAQCNHIRFSYPQPLQ